MRENGVISRITSILQIASPQLRATPSKIAAAVYVDVPFAADPIQREDVGFTEACPAIIAE
jgi:hypothetical protein